MLAVSKNQTNIRSEYYVQGGGQLFTLLLRRKGHSISMVLDTKKSSFENQKCLRFHIWFIMTLYYKMRQTLQNATAILLQNARTVLLQNMTIITKCVGTLFYK